MGKLPAIQFYPGDWLRDSISGCSIFAQGLWLRMLFVMHDSDDYGYLSSGGVAIPDEQVARRCGCTVDEYLAGLTQLYHAGVPSRTPNGIIFSRRLTRDADVRRNATSRQTRHRGKRNASVTPLSRACHTPVTPLSQHSSSSSSSSSSFSPSGNPPTPRSKKQPKPGEATPFDSLDDPKGSPLDHRQAGDGKGQEEVPTSTSTAPIIVSGSKTKGPLKNRPKASETVDHVDHHWEPPDNPFSFLDAPGCPETNAEAESEPPAVMAALDAYSKAGGRSSGKIRAKTDEMAAEYGETCVVEAILWAIGKKAPIQQAWARVRRQTWEAADASIPAKPDNSQYEKNKRIAAECAARDAERIAKGETL